MLRNANIGRPTSVESLLDETLEALNQTIGCRQLGGLQFGKIAELLAALPLASDDYAVLRQRLDNARLYCQQHQVGAARYELRLLIGRLRQAAPR